MKYLIVVDVQNDFVTGVLGTKEASAMLPRLIDKVRSFEGGICLTQDTHTQDYLNTQEGRMLPVPHCIANTEGWRFPAELEQLQQERNARVYEKGCFSSMMLATDLARAYEQGALDSVELVGLCTDICVVSNALLIKVFMPELPVSVDARCCAGVTPEKHEAALAVMESCQISVTR